MKMVIDIPEDLYKAYKGRPPMLGDEGMDMIAQSIATGTPLPKGHGDLIDRDDSIKCFRDSKKGFWRKKHFIKGEATMESMAYEINDIKNILNNAPTIIEADKEGEQE